MDIEILAKIITFLKFFKLEFNDDDTRVNITKVISELTNTMVICDIINNDKLIIEQGKLVLDIPFNKTNYLRFTIAPHVDLYGQYNLFSDPDILVDVIYAEE